MFFFSGIDSNENQIIHSQTIEKGNLYLGNIKTAKNQSFFKEKKIKFCLSVLQKKLAIFDFMQPPSIIQKTISAYDIPSFKIYPFLNEAADFINSSLKTSNILVHCGSGISRSTTCVIAFFIKYRGKTMEEGWEIVRKERSIVHPNKGFQKQLKRFEDVLRKKRVKEGKGIEGDFDKSIDKGVHKGFDKGIKDSIDKGIDKNCGFECEKNLDFKKGEV